MLRPFVLLALAAPAFAQVPDARFDSSTCYTWEGGLGAQGSYTRCAPAVVVVQTPPVVQTRETVRVEQVPGPVVRELCQSTPAPVARPHKPRPKPQPTCKP